MNFLFLTPFLIGFLVSFGLTMVLIKVSSRFKFSFEAGERNSRGKNISRFGGLAVIISFLSAVFLSGSLEFDNLKWGLIVSSLVILIFGLLDDIKNLSWKKQIFAQVFMAAIMVYSGLKVDYIANPFGGSEFRLDSAIYSVFGSQYSIFSAAFVLFLIVGFMNIVNWLDGLDGLAGGVGAIGFTTLFFLSVSSIVNQPPLGIISISIVGAIMGFLLFNFYPAKIFMGTGGSMFLGFALAVLSIFSGAKLATLALVLAIPILDAFWVIVRRAKNNRSVFKGDLTHFHYRLMELGLTQNRIVFLYYIISIFLGLIALKTNSVGKVLAFAGFAVIAFFSINFIENHLMSKNGKKQT